MENKKEKSVVSDTLNYLDGQARPVKLAAGLVCLAMQCGAGARLAVIDHASGWIADCVGQESVQELAAAEGSRALFGYLFLMLAAQKESGLRTDSAGKPVSMVEFFQSLPDSEKLLLCAFDNYIAAVQSATGQDRIRAAIEDFNLDNIPASLRFLLGVVQASADIAADSDF